MPNCGREYYYCKEAGKTLAAQRKIVIAEAYTNAFTQQITRQQEKWIFTSDEKTEWDGSIPEWCPLEDVVENG